MNLRIEISRSASSDLENIVNHTTRRWGEIQSDQYIAEIFAALDLLRDSPHLGRRVLRGREDLRVLKTGKHKAYYQIRVDHIWVIRVMHPKQHGDLSTQ